MIQAKAYDPVPRTRSRIIIIAARVASIIFHPLFMTTIMALVLYFVVPGDFYRRSSKQFNKWIDQLFLFTVVLPFMSILVLKITGLISDAKMHKPKDRILPLIATMIFYFVAYTILVLRYSMLGLTRSLLLGSCCAIAIILAINFSYKVSVHTTAAAILPGMCIVLAMAERTDTILPILLATAVAIVVGAIRWLLGSHTFGQILLGYAVGIFSQIGAYLLLDT